ncbi:MAG: hypothetical protein IPL03_17815 [Sterolibacteriaceae bacterium]|nr:hypothetical protein [Candidatus Methylophosphatis haderslevensis]
MVQRIKVGEVYLELPQGAESSLQLVPTNRVTKAEKPEEPEQLEEQQYIYRPNDPFGASIDEAHAIASIGTSHKPWVKKTWFLIFIVGPLFYGEFFALSQVIFNPTFPWQSFLGANAFIIPLWLIYFSIWRRKVRGNTPNKNAG